MPLSILQKSLINNWKKIIELVFQQIADASQEANRAF